MDREKLRSILWRRNSTLNGRLSNTRVKGLEDFYRLGEHLNDLGNFVITHFDDLSLEDVNEVLDLYSKLDGVHTMIGARVDVETNSKNAQTLSPLLDDMEEKLTRVYGYVNPAELSNRQEKLDDLTKEIERVESNLEFCSIQYVMNKTRLKQIGVDVELSSAYETCVNYVQASLETVRTAISRGESLDGYSETLSVDQRLVDLLDLILSTQDLDVLSSRISSFTRVLNMLLERQNALKTKVV